jgi:4'-phosphopantetheinyl transferase
VWWARPEDVRPEHDTLLGEADLQRRARLARPDDRRRLTAAAAVARTVLGALLGAPPAALEIDRTCPECGAAHGKPRLPAAPGVHFSVSHSGGCVAVAVFGGGPVGIDVEEVGRLTPGEVAGVADAVLAPEERAELAAAAAPARALLAYWTRKEAVVKATGEGLTAGLARLVVSPVTTPPRVVRRDGGPVWLRDLPAPPGLVAALAGLGDPPARMDRHDGGALLRGTRSSPRLSSATTRSPR